MQYTLKKSLGQHFLTNEAICKQIVTALQEDSIHQVLEVGPGAGALTKHLLKLPIQHFKAVELDREKVAYLKLNYPSIADMIIEGSILDIPIPFQDQFTLLGNFPYNISTQIVFRVLEWKEQITVMIGMFQKEVAERIVSKPHTKVYGILSVLVQAFYEVEYLFDVPPESFNPPPKVMSGVIRLKRKAEPVPVRSEKAFFTLVKAAFGQRRKMLRNPMKPFFDAAVLQEEIFTKRAEQLTVEEFAALTFKMG
ncbi:MAG: 16S rRNA (adenine(1518)-N(6)/adenine(1519)-N(6))-dimethyltransferase RsmA [Sediminibacterium sp.]|jgi:16S rRNA (adenine1518-N6/adenine1519-N6)-dimethyltransferase|uniref:16S rRNA (adenine(1518)-N(6)/adenine(1519)-N(6))- dimethyltransferase RsmA n=1 Tax=Sediminibacterium sp. TaxID=1917865 RepID=UPI002720A451|nr:16S rRNA (adenine(1518)-N(6)/adenine(1519)-N(6))-dimethyltransferase RsmA [Sediminibacterium sp.]MDO8997863.1 16S rRNA (adenine(1518)-N(6)/adenine(1519)-N(6))-dimethyltransferase RsmA [Sediminibacterium sp.]